MPVKDLVLNEENTRVFGEAMRGAMWLKFDGHQGAHMPGHIQDIPVANLLVSFNQRPVFFAGSMMRAMEMAYPALTRVDEQTGDGVPTDVMGMYTYLTEVQRVYAEEHAYVHHEAESGGGTNPGWGRTEYGE